MATCWQEMSANGHLLKITVRHFASHIHAHQRGLGSPNLQLPHGWARMPL